MIILMFNHNLQKGGDIMPGMPVRHYHLPKEDIDRIELLAKTKGITKAEIVRRAIESYLNKRLSWSKKSKLKR